MPVITLYYDDLENLTGIDKETILKRIPMLGCDIERIEDDHVDIEFFPNRPDLYSIEGVARAMRGFLGIETGLRRYRVAFPRIAVTIEESIRPIRPVLGCAVVKNLHFDSRSIESLMTLQEDLHWGLGRNRRKVSIGVHDLSRVKPPFRYLAQDPGFRFIPLDFEVPFSMREILEKHPKGKRFGSILEKFDKYPLILDSKNNVLSFPPIINGILTKVTQSTRDLLVEVTGLDETVYTALNIVVCALAERGGAIEAVRIEEKTTPDLEPRKLSLEKDEVSLLLGFKLSKAEIASNLKKMRFGAKTKRNGLRVEVPAYRGDILHTWDLIEDIAIAYGFDKIGAELPKTATIGRTHPIEDLMEQLRYIMVGLGYSQVMPFTLTNERIHYDWMRRPRSEAAYVTHPISEEHTLVRITILPNLLEILSLNKHRELPQRIFAAGEVVVNGSNEEHLAGAAIHSQANFTEILSIVDSVLRELGIVYKVEASEDPAFIEGRRAALIVEDKNIGVFGEIHPEVIVNFGLEHPIVAFEIKLF